MELFRIALPFKLRMRHAQLQRTASLSEIILPTTQQEVHVRVQSMEPVRMLFTAVLLHHSSTDQWHRMECQTCDPGFQEATVPDLRTGLVQEARIPDTPAMDRGLCPSTSS